MTRRVSAPLAIALVIASLLGNAGMANAATPTAVDDGPIVVQKSALATAIDVLANDTVDPADTIKGVTAAGHGTVEIAVDGRSITYQPAADYTGTDSFQYTVTNDPDGDASATVSIQVNAPPLAVDDPPTPGCAPAGNPQPFGGSFPIPEDWGQFAFAGPCSAITNDSDADGTIASWQVDTLPAHGDLEWLSGFPGVFGYTPGANYSTPEGVWVSDLFTYHLVDDDGAVSNEATYRFWIAPINDAPTFTAGPLSVQGSEDTPYSAAWATNVSPGPANESAQHVHFELAQTLQSTNANLFTLAPAIAANGTLSFTPAPNQTGFVRLTFVAKDDGGLENWGVTSGAPAPDDTSDPVEVDITVGPAEDAPSAADDVVTVAEDAAATSVDVLANDTDPDGDVLTVTAKTNGAKGVVSITDGGTGVSYQPNANAFGADSFTYTANDGHGGTSTATVNVTITASNDPPNAVNDGVPTPTVVYLMGGPRTILVLANDTSFPDGSETLLINSVTQGSHGTVAITGGGTALTYTPFGTATGIDLFTYTISDGHGGTDTASVQVTVARDTTRPVATITSLTKSSIAGSTKVKVTLKWTLSDAGTGIRSQLLQRRTDSGAWVSVKLTSSLTRAAAFTLSRGHTYTFRIRAVDKAGNVGAFVSRLIRI